MKKIKDCETLEDLATMFDTKTSALRQSLELRDATSDPVCCHLLATIDTTINDLANILTLMWAQLRKERESLDSVQQMKDKVDELRAKIEHMESNLPARLPKPVAPTPSPTPNPSATGSTVTTQASPPICKETVTVSKASAGPADHGKKKKSSIPSMAYLTVEEFNAVPKYMKGRLSYDQVNTAIDEFNKTLKEKYKILHTPRSKQNEPIKRKIRDYKEEENKDTKGLFFITDKDMKEFSNFKMDSVGRSILSIFRHCARMREIRGGKLTRFAICM